MNAKVCTPIYNWTCDSLLLSWVLAIVLALLFIIAIIYYTLNMNAHMNALIQTHYHFYNSSCFSSFQ